MTIDYKKTTEKLTLVDEAIKYVANLRETKETIKDTILHVLNNEKMRLENTINYEKIYGNK